MDYRKLFLLNFVVLFISSLIPQSFCQESSNRLSGSAYVNVDEINYEEGKLIQSYFHFNLAANNSFGIVIFSPSLDYSTQWDEHTSSSEGWYTLTQDYFSRGLELEFSYKELIFKKEILEYEILFGANITTQDVTEDALQVLAALSSSLRGEWEIDGIIEKVTKEEGAKYAVYGISSIEMAIENYDLKELFLLKIQITREINLEKALIWFPPIAMFVLLSVSILVIWKSTLANSLRVYLTVAFPSITYLTFLKEITPPVMTTVELLTVIDMGLCFIFAIIAVYIDFRRNLKKERKKGGKS